MVGLALARELGPVLTALMVGGRVGAGITAEIGSMQVTEQVDAIRSMGADPIQKLVLPRVIGRHPRAAAADGRSRTCSASWAGIADRLSLAVPASIPNFYLDGIY